MTIPPFRSLRLPVFAMVVLAKTQLLSAASAPTSGSVISLDGQWSLAVDPKNVGRDQKWWERPAADARPTKVPWIIQGVFPGYHGVAWYWRDFTLPANPHPQGRYVLRFWQVDYLADVWMNGVHVGQHEGAGEPFDLDVTDAVKPQVVNRIAVRVLNPTNEPIDGIRLPETPMWAKGIPCTPGLALNYGGITDSVELLVAPAVRVEDLFVQPDPRTGRIRVRANLRNAGRETIKGHIACTASPATGGQTLNAVQVDRELPPGDTLVETELQVAGPRLWELNDPYLYRVTVRTGANSSGSFDEQSTRCGFRDFRFQDGFFRLNGRRIFLKSSQTDARAPVGIFVAHDPDLPRRDLLNCKVTRHNMIRSFGGQTLRYQIELCDEIGLLVYQESCAAWRMEASPKLAERFQRTIRAMVKRDRNHPSVVMWGLLNETPKGAVFEQAVAALPLVRELDDTRVVLLNSGDWHVQGDGPVGLELWRPGDRDLPSVARNGTRRVICAGGETWAVGQMSFHPGQSGEYAVVRWTAPADETIEFSAAFAKVHEQATTDVHVLHNGKPLFDGCINVKGGGPQTRFDRAIAVRKGDVIDCACGYGNGNFGADATALAVVIKSSGGKTYDSAADYALTCNPNGPWSYGQLASGSAPKSETFRLFSRNLRLEQVGNVSNPRSKVWNDVLSDRHPYQQLPHNAGVIKTLRTMGCRGNPLFHSEGGIGSAIDLVRLARHFEQLGNTSCEDATVCRGFLDRFTADWQRWNMSEAFANPEDYFRQCVTWMADLRKLEANALRANPNLVAYNITGLVDPSTTGEGALAGTFRELKPGAVDAMFDAFAPLRWCLFVEPVQVYRGRKIRIEAVLANEDQLAPGEYPARLQVVGPRNARAFDRTITVRNPDPTGKPAPSFALPVFAEDVAIDGPPGKYRFLASFQKGAAAAGGDVEFYVADPAEMPKVETEVVLWGDDADLGKWLIANGIKTRAFTPGVQGSREVILAGCRPPAGEAEAFRELARHIARGSSAVFLCPEIFKKGDNATAWLPLAGKGTLPTMNTWLYHKDDWAKNHPIFEGLPAGCILEHTFYREVIPKQAWSGQDAPAEAVAASIEASLGYASGLSVAVYNLGEGRFTLNTVRIRENIGLDPVAERLLRNMLRYAARDAAKPPADLPADFDGQLKAMGY